MKTIYFKVQAIDEKEALYQGNTAFTRLDVHRRYKSVETSAVMLRQPKDKDIEDWFVPTGSVWYGEWLVKINFTERV